LVAVIRRVWLPLTLEKGRRSAVAIAVAAGSCEILKPAISVSRHGDVD